jgi:hypothetical protein
LAGIALTVCAVLALHFSLWLTFFTIVPLMFAGQRLSRRWSDPRP